MAFTMPIGLTDMPTVYNVRFPVGPNMPNQRDDVMLVQALMKLANFARFSPGFGPVEAAVTSPSTASSDPRLSG